MNIKTLCAIPALLTLVGLSACTPANDTPDANQSIDLSFKLTAGDKTVSCGETYSGMGSTAASLQLQDARIYVSNFRFIGADGSETPLALTQDGEWQNEGLALLDFEDATGNCNGNPVMNTTVKGTLPPGTYKGLKFEIGVPTSMNHQDPTLAPPPLNLSALSWPWRAGYKHTTIDIETAAAENDAADYAGFSIHLGATGCGEGPMRAPPELECSNQNRPQISLTEFDPASQSIIMDLGALLSNTDITTNAPDTPSGCMSSPNDADCAGLFETTGLTGGAQSFVRAG